jgi:hypothetical protein
MYYGPQVYIPFYTKCVPFFLLAVCLVALVTTATAVRATNKQASKTEASELSFHLAEWLLLYHGFYS